MESLQQTRGQLLKVSEQISSTMRSSQEQLAAKLQQSQIQLEQAKAHSDQTRTQLDQTKTELDRTRNQVSHLQTQRDQTQAQLLLSKTQLEQSRILYEETRAQNSLLHAQLEQLSAQLNQARVQAAQLQTQLQASEKSMETSNESLLIKVKVFRSVSVMKVALWECIGEYLVHIFIKVCVLVFLQESEVTRLQARISSLERAADHQHLYHHTLSLPALHQFTHSPDRSSSAHSPPFSPKKQTTVPSSKHAHSPTHTRACSSPPAHTYLQPASAPHLSNQTCDWLQSSGIDSSLDLPLSLKATLREALGKQPWESTSPSVSAFPDTVDHSWQGLSAMEATATSDLSFNPLTYMADKHDDRNLEATSMQEGDDEQGSESRRESVCTLVGQEEEEEADMSSLTGMLRFVNQTLAMQEDPSLWSSTGLSETGRNLTLQVI